MRRRTDSSGSGMGWGLAGVVDGGGEQMTEPDGDEAEDDGADHVAAGMQPLALAGEDERVPAEGGERRIAAADAGHQELPGVGAGEPPSVRLGERVDETDDKRTGHIHDQYSPGEGLSLIHISEPTRQAEISYAVF